MISSGALMYFLITEQNIQNRTFLIRTTYKSNRTYDSSLAKFEVPPLLTAVYTQLKVRDVCVILL